MFPIGTDRGGPGIFRRAWRNDTGTHPNWWCRLILVIGRRRAAQTRRRQQRRSRARQCACGHSPHPRCVRPGRSVRRRVSRLLFGGLAMLWPVFGSRRVPRAATVAPPIPSPPNPAPRQDFRSVRGPRVDLTTRSLPPGGAGRGSYTNPRAERLTRKQTADAVGDQFDRSRPCLPPPFCRRAPAPPAPPHPAARPDP